VRVNVEHLVMTDIAIRVDNLVKIFPSRGTPGVRAVDGLSFAVNRGSLFGLLGPNGAGKTTTLRILMTIVRPSSGQVSVLGHDVTRDALSVRRQIVAVIQEQAAELLLSVRDNLLTFARFHGLTGSDVQRRATRVLGDLGLTADAGRKVQDLSGGLRRRVQVAKVFMVQTPVVFLDEFSTGMDPILKRAVMELLRQEVAGGRTIVLTTQILSEAEELCDDILIMNRGKQIARGDLQGLKLLSDRIYELDLTFERLPPQLTAIVDTYHPIRSRVTQNTVHVTLRDEEARVLSLATELAAQARVLRIEINGASLEDVFVELTQRETAE
jgi:ABC-2 type transport system ATP-binding protein